MNGTAPIRIRIFRKGNGCVVADPSPVVLKKEVKFAVLNTTDDEIVVTFPANVMDPPTDTIAPRSQSKDLTPKVGSIYVEYDVELTRSRLYAEGHSKPGAIIDP